MSNFIYDRTARCKFDGCTRLMGKWGAKGYCKTHYKQSRLGNGLSPIKEVPGAFKWFMEHVAYEGDECLIWPFSRRGSDGHPQVSYQGEAREGCRLMCEMRHGKPPTPKHHAAHSCGKGHTGCINPTHLRWATAKENMADKIAHGTHKVWEAVSSAKLSERQVLAIREFAHNVPSPALAHLFNTSYVNVRQIILRKTWRHI